MTHGRKWKQYKDDPNVFTRMNKLLLKGFEVPTKLKLEEEVQTDKKIYLLMINNETVFDRNLTKTELKKFNSNLTKKQRKYREEWNKDYEKIFGKD